MAKQVLTNVRLFVGPADLTAASNKVELDDQMEEKETTNYASEGAKEVIAGLETVAINGEGQWEAGDPGYVDDHFWAHRRQIEAWTAGPHTADVGAVAYLTRAVRLNAKYFGGGVGEVAMWSAAAGGNWGLAHGVVLQSPGALITADADGTAVELGAVAATQRLVATLHVLSVAGTMVPELTVIIESDVDADFNSPTTRLSFATATAVGSEAVRTAPGAIADTFYRASFGVEDNGGTGESFLVIVALGIA